MSRHLDALDTLLAEGALDTGVADSLCWGTGCHAKVPATNKFGLCDRHADEMHG